MTGESSTHHGLCDDVIVEILARLPSKSVLRCRAVCKSWRRLTTDRAFLAAHAARRPREMLILTKSQTLSSVPLSLNPRPQDGMGRRGYLCDTIIRDENGRTIGSLSLVASLDGLLVLKQRQGLYIVCNPTTRQATTLPALAPAPCVASSACGFYFHASSGEYRLLCHGVDWEDWKDYYYVLSAGATKPRRLTRAPFKYGTDNPFNKGYQSPVAHRGVLYWLCLHPEATRTGPSKMLAYDTASETFRLVSRPPCDGLVALLELDGELCAAAAVHCLTMLHIWVLQDYQAGTWALRHQVVLPPPTKHFGLKDVAVSMAVSAGDGTILIGHPPFSPVVKLCDLRANRVRREMEFLSTPTLLVFSESLVPHAFFQSPRCSDLSRLKFSD